MAATTRAVTGANWVRTASASATTGSRSAAVRNWYPSK